MNRVVLGPDLDGTRRTIERASAVADAGRFVRRSTLVRGRHVRARVGATSARTATWTSRRRHRHRRGADADDRRRLTVDGNAMVVARDACGCARTARGETAVSGRAVADRDVERGAGAASTAEGRRRAGDVDQGERVRGSRRGDGG